MAKEWINLKRTKKAISKLLPSSRKIHMCGSAKEKALSPARRLGLPGALSRIIADMGNGVLVAFFQACNRCVVLDMPPFEKKCTNTGFSGVTRPRIASTAGATRALRVWAPRRQMKSLDELLTNIIRADGTSCLYSVTYLAKARGGAFIQKAMNITGRSVFSLGLGGSWR